MTVYSTQDSPLLTFKEAMAFLRVSRSTVYRLMWSGQLTGHKVGSTWRFYRGDLEANVRTPSARSTGQGATRERYAGQAKVLVVAGH